MLTTFPSLLMYSFFVPMILRITVAAFFAYQAVQHATHKKAVADEVDKKFTWISRDIPVWGVGLLILGELALAGLLFVGAWTQVASIFAILGLVKLSYFKKALPAYAPFARSTFLLLIIICLTLLFTGAGVFAFDLPL